MRREAARRFAERGFPDRRRDEEWRWTDLTPLKQRAYPVARSPGEVTAAWLQLHGFAGCHRLVVVDGFFQPERSELPEGVILEALERAEGVPFGQIVDEDHGFVTFNTAYFQSGWLLRVVRTVEHPLQLLFVQTKPEAALPRLLLLLEEGVQLNLISTFLSSEEGLTDAVAEVQLGRGAVLNHIQLQWEDGRRIHFSGLYVRQEGGSRFCQFHFGDGGRIARSEIHVHLGGGEGQVELTGLHLATDRRHLDSHTWIWHEAPHGQSRVRYKSIAVERGRSVFQGRILVQQGAVGSDGHMEHRGLLLSETAEIDAKPQLEIYCDDVRCTHGVAIGQFDPEALLYLRSRGIPRREAMWLLLEGFVNELLEGVPLEAVRNRLRQRLGERFGQLATEEGDETPLRRSSPTVSGGKSVSSSSRSLP